ncbi:MAG: Nif11-like leader peptide family RiPP precursor [Burkholderiales bacterium]
MSVEQAKTFLVRVDEDEQVRGSVQAAYTEELLKLAKKLGYQVSTDDLKKAITELSDVGDEVSLDQLEKVAGGIARAFPSHSDSITRSR